MRIEKKEKKKKDVASYKRQKKQSRVGLVNAISLGG